MFRSYLQPHLFILAPQRDQAWLLLGILDDIGEWFLLLRGCRRRRSRGRDDGRRTGRGARCRGSWRRSAAMGRVVGNFGSSGRSGRCRSDGRRILRGDGRASVGDRRQRGRKNKQAGETLQ